MKNVLYLYYDDTDKVTIFVVEEGQFKVRCKPELILNEACLQSGCNYRGVKESFSCLTHSFQKIPICISVLHQIIFIPTLSEKARGCCFIQYRKIRKVKRVDDQCCMVEFQNGLIQVFACSDRVIKRQMIRCERFLNKVLDISGLHLPVIEQVKKI